MAGLGDDWLAQVALHGDGRAFGVLCERYRPGLRGYLLRAVRDPEAAEDAVQDVLLRAWRGLPGRSEQNGFREWLFAIARNVAIDALNRDQAREQVSRELDDWVPGQADVGEEVGLRMRMEEMWSDLRGLPERQREALTLHEVFGFSFAQIALLGGGTAKAARQAASDGRKGLAVAAVGRERPCVDVRGVLVAPDRRSRRQGWVIAHLRGCQTCFSFERGLAAPK